MFSQLARSFESEIVQHVPLVITNFDSYFCRFLEIIPDRSRDQTSTTVTNSNIVVSIFHTQLYVEIVVRIQQIVIPKQRSFSHIILIFDFPQKSTEQASVVF